jgi:plastocyanin
MTGKMQAVTGGPGGPGASGATGPGGGGVTVVAQNIAFDTSTIQLDPAPTTITFDNRDAGVQHNLAIYSNSSLDQELFEGELVTGPDTAQYEIPPLEPGEYYFQCNVHPTMNGTVVVSDTGGGGGGGPPPEQTGSS